MSISRGQLFVVLVVALVGAAIVGGLFLIGSPAEQHRRRLDAKRISDLQEIAVWVDRFWARHGKLPDRLEELAGERGISPALTDPETAEPYSYSVDDSMHYEVCAVFSLPSSEEPIPRSFWHHREGRWCFELEANEIAR